MTTPITPEIRDAIERCIRLAWRVGTDHYDDHGTWVDGDPGREEQILHDLHTVYGTPAVRAVALALLANPAPAGGASHA